MKWILLFSLFVPIFSFEPKLCIHCKHFTKDFFNSNAFGKCKLFPKETNINYYLVDGKSNSETDNYYCSTARISDDMCGTKGIFFEKKSP
jgi:hypothetical protein